MTTFQSLDQLVAIAIAVSVFGFVVLGIALVRGLQHIANIERAIFLQLRRDKADLSRELAELKALLEE
jgi:DMSO reductase anchor subunit